MQKYTLHRETSGQFSKLANTLMYNQEALSSLIRAPFSLANCESQILLKKSNYSSENRKTLVSALKKQYDFLSPSSLVFQNIEKLAEENTFTVTTGHQLNIASGPAYVIYKIIHCICLAEELNKAYPSYSIIPVFWMATEDHDIEEVNHTSIFGKEIRWDQNQGGAVGQYELVEWESMKNEIATFFQHYPDCEILDLLKSYDGKTVAEATKSFYHKIFERFGLIVIEPNVPELKSLFVSTMQKELRSPFVEQNVLSTNEEIQKLGYTPQAFARPINLFQLSKGKRERLLDSNDHLILSKIKESPEAFSPNVMLRPAYQETILPNLVYVGGGGEISYWIQQKGIFDELGLTFPLISVRNSIQIIDASTSKKMEKIGVTWEETFQSIQDLQRNFLAKNAGDELDFSSIDEAFIKLSSNLSKQANFFDQNMEKFVDAETSKLAKQLEMIKSKFTKQSKAQFELVMKQLEDLKTKLFPKQGLQERTESFFTFCKDGNFSAKMDLIKEMMDPFEKDLIVLLLD